MGDFYKFMDNQVQTGMTTKSSSKTYCCEVRFLVQHYSFEHLGTEEFYHVAHNHPRNKANNNKLQNGHKRLLDFLSNYKLK